MKQLQFPIFVNLLLFYRIFQKKYILQSQIRTFKELGEKKKTRENSCFGYVNILIL